MPILEAAPKPKIDAELAKEIATNLHVEEGESFSYGTSQFLIHFAGEDEVRFDHPGAKDLKKEVDAYFKWIKDAGGAEGCVIKIPAWLKEQPRYKTNRRLFHEMLEADLVHQGFEGPIIDSVVRYTEEEAFGVRDFKD